MLKEDEELGRQKLVAEIAEELRPQHPQQEVSTYVYVKGRTT